jgi:hypothetical protein
MSGNKKKMVILYGKGGTADCGRHAVEVALKEHADIIGEVLVLTQYPELLEEANWNCACPGGHSLSKDGEHHRLKVVKIEDNNWKDSDNLVEHFHNASYVISALGNREPWKELENDWIAHIGTTAVVQAMKKAKNCTKRIVVMSSVGVNEDWPPMENIPWNSGKYAMMGMVFMTMGKTSYKDMCAMEKSVIEEAKDDALDYLFVRPVGIGPGAVPKNEWVIQKEKYKELTGYNVAKLDVARFCVQQSIEPTYSRRGVVIASKLTPELRSYYHKYKFFHPGFWLSKDKRAAMNSA